MRNYCYMMLNFRNTCAQCEEQMKEVIKLSKSSEHVSLDKNIYFKSYQNGDKNNIKIIPFICQVDVSYGSLLDDLTNNYSGARYRFIDVVTKRTYSTNEYLSNYGTKKFEAGEIELGQYLLRGGNINSDKVVEILKSLTPEDIIYYKAGLDELNMLVHKGYKDAFTRKRTVQADKNRTNRSNDSFIDGFGR